MTGPRLFLIAGEASGDRLGAELMRGLRQLQPGAEFAGVGGPLMASEGLGSLFPMADLSVMGISEVVRHLPRLLARRRQCVAAIASARPDALITVDSPGFCLRVAAQAKAARPELVTIHYVAPSVWAWRPKRAAHMAGFIDHVLALLPFEPPWMTAAGMTCDFVGHPAAADRRAGTGEISAMRRELGLHARQKLLALLPGSRNSELDRMLPVFSETLRLLRQADAALAVVVPAAPGLGGRLRRFFAGAENLTVLDAAELASGAAESRKRAAFAAADAALATSGTVSLELAAAGTPMVIAYRASTVTTWVLKRISVIDSPTLVNIVTGSKVVPDLLFDACTPENIAPVIRGLLDGNDGAGKQKRAFSNALRLLGRGGEAPGLRAARSVLAALDAAKARG